MQTSCQIGEKLLAHRRASDAAQNAAPITQAVNSVLSSSEEEEDHAIQQSHLSITDSDHPQIFESFRRCLDLRDKYMRKSNQRIGDNPKDYGDHFQGMSEDLADVSGVRPDADFSKNAPPAHSFKPWKIYPKPPPPHWHLTDKEVVSSERSHVKGYEEFQYEECEIPGPHTWTFKLDEKGVYQVYDESQADRHPAFDIPDIREFFVDLDYVLGAVTGGPAKSFAYRRLKYLASKFTMYTLLNEYKEMAAMKVSQGYRCSYNALTLPLERPTQVCCAPSVHIVG